MHRMKKHHKVKQEIAAASSSTNRAAEEHDLAYYIHDRVELMHQVFSVLKSKELKALAPECVRRLSISDLQELCLEELLGISSKRLCAILDGAEPPSDTESSSQSPEHLETISLDSISSDDEVLSQSSKKKKHKHRHGKKKRRRRSRSGSGSGEGRAARAGLTVLELLELQARARAIRAQLHQEPAKVQSETAAEPASSDNEVEIKEEPADVVEISSDEGKPDVAELAKKTDSQNNLSLNMVVLQHCKHLIMTNSKLHQEKAGISPPETKVTEPNKTEESQTVTKRINDLVITVPQSKPTRKIKLKRQKPAEVTITVNSENPTETDVAKTNAKSSKDDNVNKDATNKEETIKTVASTAKPKKNKKKKKKVKDKEGSDQDEITLQLSDTEKMDLLEDLDAKNLDNVSSSGSSTSDSESDEESDDKTDSKQVAEGNNRNDQVKEDVSTNNSVPVNVIEESNNTVEANNVSNDKVDTVVEVNDISNDNINTIEESNKMIEVNDTPNDKHANVSPDIEIDAELKENETSKDDNLNDDKCDANKKVPKENVEQNSDDKQKSDGELSDRDSSEVEVSDVQPKIVCISDEEIKQKKKRKKEKKSKRDKDRVPKNDNNKAEDHNAVEITLDHEDDDVYEILEISDDSSCYEVDGVSVLSKEPTAEEIEAFSARMDAIEMDKEETVIPRETETPNDDAKGDEVDVENVSWKDRYLGSKKVQRVLTTSNVLNAIRKKNKELKKKLEEAKKAELAKEKEAESNVVEQKLVEDGSIEQYETLEGSTKYVDPVKEKEEDIGEKEKDGKGETNETVTNDMKKDAKMLMKMYKRLLKYNDINKPKDPNKKKKKKQKKSKDKDKEKVKA